MDTKRCAVDGWVDAIPASGPYNTATFDLTVRPADADALPEDAPDTVVTCTSAAAETDLLRVTGTLLQPLTPGAPARLAVDALEVLDTALLPVLGEMVLDRYGDYVVIFGADTDQVPVFTASGQWVGLAENLDAITTLIDIHERVTGGDA